MKRSAAILLPLILMWGCDAPDPEAEDPFRQLSKAPANGPSNPGAHPPQNRGGIGVPSDDGVPPPNQEGGPPPDGAGAAPAPAMDPDTVVTISGTLDLGDYKGPVQMDFIHLDQPYLDGYRPMLNVLRLEKPGKFSLSIPKGQGRIQVVTYLDLNDDGLGSGDTQAYWDGSPFKVKKEDIDDLDITIKPNNPQPAPPLEGVELPEASADVPSNIVQERKDMLETDGEPPTPDPSKKLPPEGVIMKDGIAPPPPEGGQPVKEAPAAPAEAGKPAPDPKVVPAEEAPSE